MDIRETLARNIRVLRNRRGWSQEELAHQAGINRGHVSDMERAKYYARLDRLEMIAGALALAPHELLDPATALREDDAAAEAEPAASAAK